MIEPRLCEFMKHRRAGGFGWIAKYEATVVQRVVGEPDWYEDGKIDLQAASYAYLSGWYSGMLNELLTELGERELEHVCQRLRRRQGDIDNWIKEDRDDK